MPDLHPTFAKVIARLERRSPLGEAGRSALLGLPYTFRKLAAGAHIVRDGDKAEYCAVLLSGFAFRYKITGDGGRQIISIHMASEFVDLQHSFLGVADTSVQTLTESEVALIPRGAIEELALTQPAVGRALWIDTLIDASIFREWVVNVGRRDSRARIGHILCEFSLRLESAGLARNHRYELPMTQEQLADAVGLTSVHVNRVLRQLGEGGADQPRQAPHRHRGLAAAARRRRLQRALPPPRRGRGGAGRGLIHLVASRHRLDHHRLPPQ